MKVNFKPRFSRLALFRIGMFVVILIAGGIFYAKAKSAKNAAQQLANQASLSGATLGGFGSPNSEGQVQGDPEIIKVIMTDEINPDHTPKREMSEFSTSTENIYAVMVLRNVTKNTSLGYKRYFNDEFVNENTLNPPKDDAAVLAFQWKLDDGKKRIAGNYHLVFYVDGKESQSVDYVVKE